MEILYTNKKIELEKELNSLDEFVIGFTKILNDLKIKYAVISGYVSILFGRNRSSEDVDIIIENLEIGRFRQLWDYLNESFECINTNIIEDIYKDYLLDNTSIRFSKKGQVIPNMELKFPKNTLDSWTIKNRRKIVLNSHIFFVSPFELQIPYKLYLGSEKDIEDAKFLYNLFEDRINSSLFDEFIKRLKVGSLLKRYLK
ncbi:MAG: hypothetical protein KKF44_04645 [Nanoarchaeota archaeon]|nr:hypothetical protein [Nanoarchaeota archaeon]